jgi:hypothetical protein
MRDRSEDTWDETRIAAQVAEVQAFGNLVVLSGGLAWHFMSPLHTEYRRLHDHKDVDLFVSPENVQEVLTRLQGRGFERQWTKYDRTSTDFYRYTKYLAEGDGKIMIDLFIGTPTTTWLQASNVTVVEPKRLLGFYETSHSSKGCVAVQAALKLVAQGVDPIGRPELIGQ